MPSTSTSTRAAYRRNRRLLRTLNRISRLECGTASRLAFLATMNATNLDELTAACATNATLHAEVRGGWTVGLIPREHFKRALLNRYLDRITSRRPAYQPGPAKEMLP